MHVARIVEAFRPVVPAEVMDARAEADALLAAARAEAEALRSSAEAEVARAVEEARAEARAELAGRIAQALAEVERLAGVRRQAWETAVARAALEVATKVLGEVEVDSAAVAQAAAHAIAREIEAAPGLRIRVHPDDAPFVEVGEIPVVADPKLSPGDVVVQTPGGLLDGRRATREAIALDALAEALGLARPGAPATREVGP